MDALKRVEVLVPIAATAGAAWGTAWAGVSTAVVLLPCWGAPTSRRDAALVAFAYYMGGAREMPAAVEAYYRVGFLEGVLGTLLGASLLTLPWAALWTAPSSPRGVRVTRAAGALLLVTLPPFGLVGVCNPVAVAGTLLPGLGWASVLMTLALLSAASTSPRAAAALVIVAMASHHLGAAPASADWRAVDTEIRSVPAPRDYAAQFERAVGTLALLDDELGRGTGAHLVLPETAGGSWTRAMHGVWEPLIDRLRAEGRCLILGVLDPQDDYANGVRAVGACDGALRQRVPLPGAQAPRLRADGYLVVDGKRVGVLICFESHLAWPVLQSAAANPSALLVLANLRPIRATRAETAQRVVMTSWARAFDLPLHIATNR
ncbi:MAG: hypothetical protein KC621_14140 [Myxococcales bacterium]|nr:hypothetical protein [Myxococcales bacterium]